MKGYFFISNLCFLYLFTPVSENSPFGECCSFGALILHSPEQTARYWRRVYLCHMDFLLTSSIFQQLWLHPADFPSKNCFGQFFLNTTLI